MRIFALFLLVATFSVDAFLLLGHNSRLGTSIRGNIGDSNELSSLRRDVLLNIGFLTGSLGFSKSALAIPMVTVDEFSVTLRDSSLSVQVVEFSGAKSENVVVKLVDGTSFGIKDVVESPTDPRSPLKVAAACRENGVKTKFVDLENILSTAPKKKKLYTNQRVQEAQEKEKARLERIENDEKERVEQLRAMQQAGQ